MAKTETVARYSWFRYEYKGKEYDIPSFNAKGYIVQYLEQNNLPLSEYHNFKFISQIVGKELPNDLKLLMGEESFLWQQRKKNG
tara:strand:+ start:49 stop:300 length:252 start_codon:yes stop_codon:yes gene_type:complete